MLLLSLLLLYMAIIMHFRYSYVISIAPGGLRLRRQRVLRLRLLRRGACLAAAPEERN